MLKMELLMMKILIIELLKKFILKIKVIMTPILKMELLMVLMLKIELLMINKNWINETWVDTESWISDDTDVKNQIFGDTVDIHYLEYLVSWTFTMSKFLFGPFSILINFPYRPVRHLKFRYPKFSLCRRDEECSRSLRSIFSNIPIRFLN